VFKWWGLNLFLVERVLADIGYETQMLVMTRLVSLLLVLTLGGGAQACIASCANPAATAMKAQRPTCHRCEKTSHKTPEAPCPRCQLAGQDRAVADGNAVAIPAPDLIGAALPEVSQSLSFFKALPVSPRGAVHGPPGDLFHQFCLLLI
jgi:hypothetical protein